MWTYLGSILSKYLGKYPEKSSGLRFNEIADFIFGTVGKKHKLLLYDGKRDLLGDLLYGEKIGIWELHGNEGVKIEKDAFGKQFLELPTNDEEFFKNLIIKVNDIDRLKEIEKIVENSPDKTGVQLFEEYNQRVENAIKDL